MADKKCRIFEISESAVHRCLSTQPEFHLLRAQIGLKNALAKHFQSIVRYYLVLLTMSNQQILICLLYISMYYSQLYMKRQTKSAEYLKYLKNAFSQLVQPQLVSCTLKAVKIFIGRKKVRIRGSSSTPIHPQKKMWKQQI